jgi:hypothetical protein
MPIRVGGDIFVEEKPFLKLFEYPRLLEVRAMRRTVVVVVLIVVFAATSMTG